ncbi:hypothetical protein QTO30_07420 [Yoonia sp. GPGPB17]|uniref:hypothetical protein n=1 Tax=Yoonia sp. GPGPB17 TaxID=3026147 RepID=UPI0030C262D7
MRDWLPYTAAFGLALLSTFGGFALGVRTVMSGYGYDVPAFFAVVFLLPVIVGYGVFVISYAAFSDRWLGWVNATVGAVLVVAVTTGCFLLIKELAEHHVLYSTWINVFLMLILVCLFVGGRLLLKRASLV